MINCDNFMNRRNNASFTRYELAYELTRSVTESQLLHVNRSRRVTNYASWISYFKYFCSTVHWLFSLSRRRADRPTISSLFSSLNE